MPNSLQRIKKRSDIQTPYFWRLFTVNYKGSWYWREKFKEFYEHPKFRTFKSLQKFYDERAKS